LKTKKLMNKSIKIDSSALPAAPHILIQMIDICTKSTVSFDELESVISKDPTLTAKVISIANSAAYSQWNDVLELKRILVVLGTKTVKTIALTSAVHQFFSRFESELGQLLGDVWLDALTTAHMAKSIAELTSYENPAEAYLLGLMHNIGKLLLINESHQTYLEVHKSSDNLKTLLSEEKTIFGINSSELAGDIFAEWNMPFKYEAALRYQYADSDLMIDMPVLSKLINLVARVSYRVQQPSAMPLIDDHFFGLNQEIIDEYINCSIDSASTDAKSFGIKLESSDRLSVTNMDNEETRLNLAKQVHQISLVDGSLNQLLSIDSITELLQGLSNQLILLFGFSKSKFFLFDTQQTSLTEYLIGRESDTNNAHISADPINSLIAQAAVNMELLISNHQHFFDELPMIDQLNLHSLKSEALVCIPLRADSSKMGVIIAGCSITQANKFNADPHLISYFGQAAGNCLNSCINRTEQTKQQIENHQLESHLKTRAMVHEVSNPLTIVSNYLEVLDSSITPEDTSSRHIETIRSEIDRIGNLLLQFRDSNESNEVEADTETHVNQLITQITELLEPTFYKLNSISSNLTLDDNLPLVDINKSQLKQILINLMKNAAEALPENGIITVQTKALVIHSKKKYFEIKVSDNGTGIPDNLLSKLFTPVQSTKGNSHAGLGLTIVYQLVTNLHGEINYSQSDDGGAEFTLIFPRE